MYINEMRSKAIRFLEKNLKSVMEKIEKAVANKNTHSYQMYREDAFNSYERLFTAFVAYSSVGLLSCETTEYYDNKCSELRNFLLENC